MTDVLAQVEVAAMRITQRSALVIGLLCIWQGAPLLAQNLLINGIGCLASAHPSGWPTVPLHDQGSTLNAPGTFHFNGADILTDT